MRKILSKKYLILIGLIFFLALPEIVLGFELQLDYPEILEKDLNEIINLPSEQQLSNFVLYLYYFFLSIAGIAAFIMIVWGGISYLTSAGKPTAISEAKNRIFKAFLGLVILLASYLILNTISPELVLLKPPEMKPPCCSTEQACLENPELTPCPQVVVITEREAPTGCNFVLDEEGNPTKEWECPVKPCIGNWPCENEELLGRVWIDIDLYTVCCEEGREGTSEDCPYLVGDERVCTWNDFNVEYYNEEYLCCWGEIEEKEKCEGIFSDIAGCRIVEAASCDFPEPPYSPCDPETEEMDDPAPNCRLGAEGVGCWQCCLK